MESWQDEIIKAQISQEIGVERSMENSDTSIFLKSFEDNLISCVDRDSFDKSWSSDLAKKFPEGGWRTINGASVFINNGKVIAGLDGFNKEIDTFFEQKGKKTEGKKKENNKMESLLKIMDGKVKNNGYSLKKLYDEVLWGHGSSNGAAIFSEFIKRKKEEGDTKVMDEFNRTSFVENVNPNNNKKPKTTEKEENKGEITIDTFVDIAKKSKDVKDFMRKVVAIKGVPSSVANEFQNKYGNGGELTMEQASQNFMDVAKGKEKEVTKEKPQEPRTKRESKSSKANKRMHSLEGYKSSKSDADSINSYKELNKITKELDPKLMSSKDKESEAKLIEEIQENFWSPDDSDRSKELSDVVWNSNSIKESMDAVNKLQRIASKTDYSVLDDKTMDKIKDGVATMLQNQINKKETERLNYKLF